MLLTIVESPFAGNTKDEVYRNKLYAQLALHDSLLRGEAPFASHLIYTLVLDDKIPDERLLGMNAGWYWMRKAEQVAVYTDSQLVIGWLTGAYKVKQPHIARLVNDISVLLGIA